MDLRKFLLAVVSLLAINGILSLPCGNPGNIYNGTIVGQPSYNVGGIVRFKCNKCFQRKGPSMILCSKWSRWSGSVPKCIPNKCPVLKLNENEMLPAKPYGYEYHFQCDASSVLIGQPIVRCTCHGRWSSKPPVCQPLSTTVKPRLTTSLKQSGYCEDPGQLINGFMFPVKYGVGDKFQPGDRVYFLCKDQYRLIGPKYRECNVDLEWKYEHPFCQRKDEKDNDPGNIAPEFHIVQYCPKLFPPINGEAIGTNRVGDVLLFKCHEGYKLVGEEYTRCQLNGLWSKDTPTCEPVCASHVCPGGQECRYNSETKLPECTCDLSARCPKEEKQVCGSDGQTYRNECIMNLVSCMKKKNITKVADKPCQSAPICYIKPSRGCNKSASVYRYNWLTNKCEHQQTGTCHPSGWDGYSTVEECETSCKGVCSKKWDSGPCRSSGKPKVRWLFYPNVNGCRPFLYYGCFGNGNNFETREQCQTVCLRNIVLS